MPANLRLIARLGNGGFVVVLLFTGISLLFSGKVGDGFLVLAIAALLGFNLYLIEKAAGFLSEEEWLKGQIRKNLLRRKLARLEMEDWNAAAKTKQVEPNESDIRND